MTRLAVFDCDGTLIDGQASICEAMEAAFNDAGTPVPERAAVRRVVGLSLPQGIRLLAPEADADRQAHIVERYKHHFFTARTEGRLSEPLFEGMRELLTKMHADGWVLGVATGKSRRGLDSCLAVNGIADLFTTLQPADDHPSKPDPTMLRTALEEAGAAPGDTVMIGDTTFDIDMAAAADIRAIGVAWGYHEADELLASGAIGVAENIAELEALIYG